MIQILALRGEGNRKSEVWFDKGYRATSVEAIFEDPEKFIKEIPPSERFNVYYTIASCLETPGRKLESQHYIPFDVDKLELGTDVAVDLNHLELVAQVVAKALEVDYNKIGVLFSGNGLQFVIRVKEPILEVGHFDAVRRHYKAICDRINLRLAQAKLKGEADVSVWSSARLMRMPLTENRKPGKTPRQSRILQHNIEELDFDLKKVSGLPDVKTSHQISAHVLNAFPTPDVKTIVSECKFMNYAQTMAEKLSEPEWYAAVSVSCRFPEGRAFTHRMSEGHPGYTFEETDKKIDQAMENSGPRTCENINIISGGKCKGCKHFGTSLKSPILIEGPDHVKTAKSGFHNVFVSPEGNVKKGKPDYDGLQRWFQKDFNYKSVETAQTIWVYNGTHFEEMSKDRIYQYANDHFDPKPLITNRKEFFEVVRLKNMVPIDWFNKSIEGKMNFRNGVLDVKSGILLEHSTEYGFRSVLPCDHSKDAQAPRFMQFMDEVTLGRQGLIDVLQEFMGYIFANGDCKYEKVLVLLGHGSNGKSKFVNLIRALAGQQAFSSLSIKAMKNDQNRYLMEGKLVNIAEENSKDSFDDTELLKNMASGGYIQVKKLFAQPYEYENRTKLVMLCNEAPYTKDLTHGFYRKLLMVPFDQTFSHEKKNIDPNIGSKMLAELPGILNWAMEGYKRLEKNEGFTQSTHSDAIMTRYKMDTDSVLGWALDNLEFVADPEICVNRMELYTDYRSYCEMAGLKAVSAISFNNSIRKLIQRAGYTPVEMKRRKDDVRFYTISNVKHLTIPKY